MSKFTQPTWVCVNCGRLYGRSIPNCATWHIGQCDVCQGQDAVTEARDFGYLGADWKDHHATKRTKWPKDVDPIGSE